MKALKVRRSLAETYPEIASQWHPTLNGELTPYHVTFGIDKKVWWLCDRGHEWQARVYSRTRGSSCPECAPKIIAEKLRKAAVRRKGSLSETHPEIAGQWHPTKNGELTPEGLTSGSREKVWWLCDEGHEWQAIVNNRTGPGTGCRECFYETIGEKVVKAALKKRGSLAKTHPEIASQWHPTLNGELTPYHVTFGSRKKVWWVCDEGHEWQAIVYNRTRLGRGCPECYAEKRKRARG